MKCKRSPRLEIDSYFELFPHKANDEEFHGICPITGEKDGIILTEDPFQILLPYIGKDFCGGHNPIRDFYDFCRTQGINLKKRIPKINLTNQEVKEVNDQLKKLSLEILNRSFLILENNKNLMEKFPNCGLDVCVEFYLNENHRLFHPKSDNILYSYSEFFTFDDLKETELHILEDEDNYNDSKYYQEFNHCYLFHDLFDHAAVSLEDLMYVDTICIDFNLLFQIEKSWGNRREDNPKSIISK